MAPSTLAHHLKFLSAGGLVTQEKSGRSTINRASFDALRELADFILSECCADACPAPRNDETCDDAAREEACNV